MQKNIYTNYVFNNHSWDFIMSSSIVSINLSTPGWVESTLKALENPTLTVEFEGGITYSVSQIAQEALRNKDLPSRTKIRFYSALPSDIQKSVTCYIGIIVNTSISDESKASENPIITASWNCIKDVPYFQRYYNSPMHAENHFALTCEDPKIVSQYLSLKKARLGLDISPVSNENILRVCQLAHYLEDTPIVDSLITKLPTTYPLAEIEEILDYYKECPEELLRNKIFKRYAHITLGIIARFPITEYRAFLEKFAFFFETLQDFKLMTSHISSQEHLNALIAYSPQLKSLILDSIDNITTIPPIPELQTCTIISCKNLISISSQQNLTYLNISFCDNLISLTGPEGFPSLEALKLKMLSKLSSLPYMPNLKSCDIFQSTKLTSIAILEESLQLNDLTLYDIPISILPSMPMLKSCVISSNHNLTSLDALAASTQLTKLDLSVFRELPTITLPVSLESCTIAFCTNLSSITAYNTLPNLKKIELNYLKNLTSIPSSIISPECCSIIYCPKLLLC